MGEWGISAIYNYHMNKESKEMKEQEQDQFSRMESYHQQPPKKKQSIFKMCEILYDMIDDALDPEHSTQEEDALAYVQQNIEPKLDAFVYVIKGKEARSKALLEDVKVKREEAQILKNATERIKYMMIETLEQRGMKEMLGDTCKIRIRKHGGKEPLLIEDEDLLEDKWFKQRVMVDKTAIREALQAGESIPGCSFGERGRGLTIK